MMEKMNIQYMSCGVSILEKEIKQERGMECSEVTT
jgi:hypothetical protein